jgi:predicted 3-demethylubiquinone-9 3-methyltransferase (glyoxalase superfamily)
MRPLSRPFLWFDTEAEDAANFYTSVFANSRIVAVTHHEEAGPRPAGMVMTVVFELNSQRSQPSTAAPSRSSTTRSRSSSTARTRTRSTATDNR